MEQLIEGRNNEEIVSYVPINELKILVHPLDEAFGEDILKNNFTTRVRRNFFNDAIHEFIPQSPNDVLVIIPNVGETLSSLRREVLKTEIEMQLYDDPYSWITLYEYAKRNAVSKRNVFLSKNIPDIDIPSTEVEAQLKGRGFGIMSNTRIIIGGELVENCIADTAKDFLSLPQVPYVLIDRKISLGISEYAKHGPIPQTSDQASVIRLMKLGYTVSLENDPRYIKVVRP